MQQRHWTIHKPIYSTGSTSLCNKSHLQLHICFKWKGCPPAPKILEGRGGAGKCPFGVRLNCLTSRKHLCEHTALCFKKSALLSPPNLSCPMHLPLNRAGLPGCYLRWRRWWIVYLVCPATSINNCRTQLQWTKTTQNLPVQHLGTTLTQLTGHFVDISAWTWHNGCEQPIIQQFVYRSQMRRKAFNSWARSITN